MTTWRRGTAHVRFALALLVGGSGIASAAALELASGGQATCVIIQAVAASPADVYAAEELAEYLRQVTGATFSVVSEAAQTAGPRLIVGPGALSRSILGRRTVDRLGAEEFLVRTVGSDLLLVGGQPRGTLYAVYHFLDRVVGIRWWAPGATYVPKNPNLAVEALNLRDKPGFAYRDVFLTTAWNADWAARNRLNGRVRQNPQEREPITPDARHGGGVAYGDWFVHTFNSFVPPETYFDAHPEWFSEIDGKRAKGYYQLCLTNAELVDFMAEQVKAALRKDPGISIVSVSQNDSTSKCECVNCRKVDEEEGSPAGSLLRFVNAVAERIEKEYPHVYVDTLAYQYTRRPPKHVRPRRNVIVRLCDIECSFAQPLESQVVKTADSFAKSGPEFAEDLRGWAAISRNLYVWDYIADFANYFRPHPNLRVLGPNLRFFARTSVQGVFEQGSYMTPSGEMEELRAWMLARLLWNPAQDDRALIDEFVQGYYGNAAVYISEYLTLTHDTVEQTPYWMSCFASDPSPYVTPEIMARAEALFQQAEAAVAGEPDVLNRVRRAHLPVLCMWLVHYNDDAWATCAKKAGSPVPSQAAVLAAFSRQVEADGVTFRSEGAPMSAFLDSFRNPASVSSVRASGNYGSGFPFCVFDGTAGFWNSGGFGPQWIQKDLEKVVKVKAVYSVFNCANAGVRYDNLIYKIEGSLDGNAWRDLVAEKSTRTGEGHDLLSPPVETRFVRTTLLQATSAANPKGEWVGMSKQTIEVE